MRLFAEHAAAQVTIRKIAPAAGVSPSLVIHLYGSKDGLKEAVDVRRQPLLSGSFELVDPSQGDGAAHSLAAVFAEHFEREPVLPLTSAGCLLMADRG